MDQNIGLLGAFLGKDVLAGLEGPNNDIGDIVFERPQDRTQNPESEEWKRGLAKRQLFLFHLKMFGNVKSRGNIVGRLKDVHGNDLFDPLMRKHIRRQRIENPAVDDQAVPFTDRLDHPWDGDAFADGVDNGSAVHDDLFPADQVIGNDLQRNPGRVKSPVTDVFFEPTTDGPPANQARNRENRIQQIEHGPLSTELFGNGFDLTGVFSDGPQTGEDRAHTASHDHINGDLFLFQDFEDTDVSDSQRRAASQNQPH